MGTVLQGNEACVEGAISAGMRFFSGYPITPSTEIAESCAVRLPQVGGIFIEMEDEMASIAAAIGASVSGTKAMTATSGPGFSLMQENLGYACAAEAPIVIVDVQRLGPSTGLPTAPSQADVMQTRWGTHGDHPAIVLSPSSVKEAYQLTALAFELAEKYRTPVIVLMDEMVAHMREGIDCLGSAFEEKAPADISASYPPNVIPRPFFSVHPRCHITGLIHGDDGLPSSESHICERLISRLMSKIEANMESIVMSSYEQLYGSDILLVCYGGTVRAARDVVLKCRDIGCSVGIFRPITIWPFPESDFLEAAKKSRLVITVEHNYGQLALEVERILAGEKPCARIGKIDGTVITPEDILEKIEEVLPLCLANL